MKKMFLAVCILFSVSGYAQTDTTKWLRAFPITGYMVDLNDSVKVVQLLMPEGHVIKDKQLGLIRGTYRSAASDTAMKGYGRCNLIKGDYYYFTISKNQSGIPLQEGDLLYTFMDKTAIYYGRIVKLASYFIQLQDVYKNRFFDRYTVFLQWTEEDEKAIIDSMVRDIKFTGDYFLKSDTSKNMLIKKGTFNGKRVLDVMASCDPGFVTDFIDYLLIRPRQYAGREWKITEIFATWLIEGAPGPAKN